MTDRKRVLVIENQKLVRLGIASVLNDEFEVVGEAETGAHGFELFRELRPDVTILGLRLTDSCAIDFLDDFFLEEQRARIIILADHAGDSEISRALKKGALGYICKDVSPEALIKALHSVASGKKFIPTEIAAVLSEHAGSDELTKAETRTLQMIVGGMSNKEIAFALDVSENTVKTHIKNIFQKLGVSDRTSAATTAIKRGLVRIDV
ncbi:MAG: response regulator transcription factor [Acidobacteria bacterium]|nr:response regulator transcription factor [Acidobacteriota bacterium]